MAADGGCITTYDKYTAGWKAAVKNFSDPEFQIEWGQEIMDTLRVSQVIPRPCFNCPIGCAQDIVIGKGPYKGYRSTCGGGLENYEGIGGHIGVKDGGTVLYLTDLADRLGVEASSIGQPIALLYECYEKGIIDREFTDGLELKWGDADAAIILMNKMIKREGIGKLLAEGLGKVAQAIGHGTDQFLGSYKGLAFSHDDRCSWEKLLARSVADSPGCIEGLGVEPQPEPDIGWKESPPPYDRERTPVTVYLTKKVNRWWNCLGICLFSVWSMEGAVNYYTPKALSLAVGWDFNKDEALLVAERVINLMHIFNLRRGLTIEDDLDIGPRLLVFPSGPIKTDRLDLTLREWSRITTSLWGGTQKQVYRLRTLLNE